MQYKHLFWGHLNRQHPTPLLKLKILSLFWSWRTAVQKILEFPRKKLLRLCFLTPALSVLDTWMCCQHSDLPERNILLTRKYGSKNSKANWNYLLNFSTPKEIGCSGLLLSHFSHIHKFFSFPDEKLQKKVCNHIPYVQDTCKCLSIFWNSLLLLCIWESWKYSHPSKNDPRGENLHD